MKGLLLVELEVAATLSEALRWLRDRYAAPPRSMWTAADGGMASLEAMEARAAQRWDVHRAEIVRQTPHEAALVARLEVYDAAGARVASRPAVRYGLLSADGERCTLYAVCLVLGEVVLAYLCDQLWALTTARPPRAGTWTLFAKEPPPPWLEAAAVRLARLGLERREVSVEAMDQLNYALAASAEEPAEEVAAATEEEPALPRLQLERLEYIRANYRDKTDAEMGAALSLDADTVKKLRLAHGLRKRKPRQA